MRESIQARPRLFLTFAGDDLALARPVAAQLRSAGGVSLVAVVTLLPAVRRFCGGTLGR